MNSLLEFVLKNAYFTYTFEGESHWINNSSMTFLFFIFFFQHFEDVIAWTSGFYFSFEKTAISLIHAPLKVMCLFSLGDLKTLVYRNFSYELNYGFLYLSSSEFVMFHWYISLILEKISAIIFSNIASALLSLFRLLWLQLYACCIFPLCSIYCLYDPLHSSSFSSLYFNLNILTVLSSSEHILFLLCPICS